MTTPEEEFTNALRPTLGDSPRELGKKLATVACPVEPTPALEALADELLALGADVTVTDDHGCTALLNASEAGNAKLVEKLLAKGADPNAADNRPDHLGPAICHAACKGNAATIRLLLKAGANPDAQEPTAGRCALWLAVDYARGDADGDAPEKVKALIEGGANPNQTTSKGWTPLHDCFNFKFPAPATAKYLLDHGADPTLRCSAGTPYEMAKERHPDIAQYILDKIAEREEAARIAESVAAENKAKHEKWLSDGCPTTEEATPMRKLQLRPKV
jgi:hypothetical protein